MHLWEPVRRLADVTWLLWRSSPGARQLLVPAVGLIVGVLSAPQASWASRDEARSEPGAAAEAAAQHPDPAIHHALSLLGSPVPVPIEVVHAHDLPDALRRGTKQACAYIRPSVTRIFVNAACQTYISATRNPFEAMKLAAILRHELAHLEGHDEVRARLIEARTIRELMRRGPTYLITKCMGYAAEIEQHAGALAAAQRRQADTVAAARPAL